MRNDPLRPNGGVLLSMSTCSVIATELARELRGVVNYSTVGPSPIIAEGIAALPDDPGVLLDAEQVAGILSVKKSTVFELSRRRLDPLPSVLIGRAKRFDREAVTKWVERQGSRRS